MLYYQQITTNDEIIIYPVGNIRYLQLLVQF